MNICRLMKDKVGHGLKELATSIREYLDISLSKQKGWDTLTVYKGVVNR